MQTAEVKTSSAAQSQIQAKRQPFFNKEGQDSFFSKPKESTSSFFGPTTIQPKLTIGQPNDKYEVEADQMADKVVQRLADPSICLSPTGHDSLPTNIQPQIQKQENDTEVEEPVNAESDSDSSTSPIDFMRKDSFRPKKFGKDWASLTRPFFDRNVGTLLDDRYFQRIGNLWDKTYSQGINLRLPPKLAELAANIATPIFIDNVLKNDYPLSWEKTDLRHGTTPTMFNLTFGEFDLSKFWKTIDSPFLPYIPKLNIKPRRNPYLKDRSSVLDGTIWRKKIKIGQPNDKYEVEADAMVDKVVQRLSAGNDPMHNIGVQGNNAIQRKCHDCEQEEQVQQKEEPLLNGISKIQRKPIFESNAERPDSDVQTKPLTAPSIQSKCNSCEQEEKLQKKEDEEFSENEMGIQTKSMDVPGEASPNLQSRLNSSKGSGSSLSPDVQTSMGSAFGADFSSVRAHTGSEAVQMNQEIGAQAFTHGSDIYFNQGKYNTHSNSGKHLLAHELTHTVQQGGGRMNNQLRLNPESDAADEMLFYQNPYEVQVFAHVIRGLVFNFIDKGLYWKQGIMKGNQALASVLKALAGKEYTVQLVKDFHNNYTPKYYGGLQNIAEKEDLAKQFAFEVGLSMQIIDFLESKNITVNLTPEQRDILQQNLDINLFYKDLKDFNESDLPKWFTKSHFFIFSTTAGLKNEVRSYAINKPISHKDGDGAFEAEVKANEAYDKIYDSLIFYFNIFEALRQDEKLLDQGLYRGMWNLPAIDYSKKTQIKIGIASADASLDLRVAHTFALQCNTNTSAAKKAHKNNKEGHEARLDLMGMTGSKMIAAGLEKEAMGDVGLAEAINRYNAPPAPSSLKVYPSLRPPYFEMATKTEPVFEMNVQWADFYEALGAAFSVSYVFDLIKIPDDKVRNIKKTHQGINEPAKGGAENHVEKGKPAKKEKGTFEKAEDELKDLDDIANDPKTEGEQQTLSDVIDQRYNRRVDYLAEDIETTVDDMEGIFGVPAGGGVIRLAMVGQAIGLIGDVISSFVDAIMMERYQKKVPIGKPGFYIVRAIAYNPDIPSDAKFVRAPSVAWMPIWAQSPENMSFTHLEHQLSVYEANKARIEKLESLLVSPINLSEEDSKEINKELAALKFHVFGTLTQKLKKEKEVLTTYKKQAKDDKEKERIENRIREINNILETRKERIEENKNSDTSLETWFSLPAVFVDDKFGNVRKLSLEFIQKPAAKGKYKYFVSDLTTDKGGTEEGPEESSRVSAIREAVKEYMGEPDRYGRGYCTIQITPRKGTKDKPVAIVLRVKPKGKAIVMESIDNIASAINIVALVAAPFTGGASLVILLPVGLVGSIPAGYRLYNKYIDDTLRMDYGTAMDVIDIVGSLTAIGGKAADMAVAAGRMRMVPMQKGFAMVGLGADRLGYVVGSAQLLEDIKQIQSDDSLPPSLRRAKLMMRMGQELQTIGMVVGGKIYGDGKLVYDENKDLKPKQLPDSSTTKPADGDDASANKKPTKDTPEIDTDTDSNNSSDSTVKVPDSNTVAPTEKPVEKLKAKVWNDPLLTEQDFINQYEAAVADGSLKTTKKDPFERLAWLRQKYRDGWRFRPGKGWRKPFKKKVETAKKTKAKSDTQRTKDAATYLKSYPTRLLRGEGRFLQGLLDIHGNWKALIAQLESGSKKDQQIAKLLGQYRDQIVQDIIKTRNGEARTLPDASTRPESDIDLNFYGNDAGEKMLETEAQMEAAHGPDWSEKLRMNFYTEPGRLTRYQDAQGSLSKDKKASWDDQITSYTTLLNFTKMLLHAKGDKAAQKRIETLMESAGVNIDQVKGLTKESPSSRDAKRKALALEIDQLEDKYRTAKGDEKHELALKITLKQMEANFYSTEAYIGPGSVIKGKDKLTPTEAYQSMFSQLEMIEHVIHLLGGDIVKAMREYEIYKYMYRFSETVGAKQMDLFYDQLTKKLYKLDRDGAKGFTDTQILALWKDFHGYANKSIKNENITTTGALIDSRPPKEKFPDHLPPGESHTFEDRAKARRRKDGTLVIESVVGPGPGRKGYENKLLLGTEVGLEGWQRAHSHGQGTGHENPYGILYAPEEVNQQIQNRGIEAHIRELFISVPPEYTIHMTTETTAHPGTLRLKTIIYKLEISRMEGKRSRLYEAEIGVADKRDAPRVTVEATPYGITDFKTTEPDLTPGPKADKKDLGKTHKKAQGALMNLEKLYTQLKTKNLDPSYKAYREILRNLRNDLLRNPSIDNVNNVNEAVKEIKSSLGI